MKDQVSEVPAEAYHISGWRFFSTDESRYNWLRQKYEWYVDYFEDYNYNRRPADFYCTVKILSFDEWFDANQQRLERKYNKFLSTSDES